MKYINLNNSGLPGSHKFSSFAIMWDMSDCFHRLLYNYSYFYVNFATSWGRTGFLVSA